MDKLDKFVERVMLPAHNSGQQRRVYKPYLALYSHYRRRKKAGQYKEAKATRKQLQKMPSLDPYDPGFRRLWYVRYADDTLLGFSGWMTDRDDWPKEAKKKFEQCVRASNAS